MKKETGQNKETGQKKEATQNKDSRIIAEELLRFIEQAPSCFHAIEEMKKQLDQAGFTSLQETADWSLQKGGAYYVTRNQSSLIAFRIPKQEFTGYQIMASHSDAPTFKLKEAPEMQVENQYVKLNVEKYGGMICSTWFDRPLSIAGRVLVKEKERITTRLVNIDRDLVLIPNLAIHMNRKINEGYTYNVQKDLLPLYGGMGSQTILELVAEQIGVDKEQILGKDLFLYNRMPGTVWGANDEFVSSAKLDDLQCAFASLKGFLAAKKVQNVAMHCVFDNEEVGSGTKQGAASGFLQDVMERIQNTFAPAVPLSRYLASSFMVSADNAHAVHPNDTDKADPTNRPYLNGGIVMKGNANQKYTTDAVSEAIFRMLVERAGVPCQSYLNRSDIAGGSTLGNISNQHIALNTVDIGLPQLAMHSAYETAGMQDTQYLVEFAKTLYETGLQTKEDGVYTLL